MKKKAIPSPTASPEVAKFMEDVGLFYETHGIPRIGGRILALMLVTEGMLSADQIAKRLRVSRGSISTNVRLLLNIGLIEKQTIPGNRLDYFRFSTSAWENVFAMRLKAFLRLQKLAQQGLSALPSGDPVRRRLDDLMEWLVFYQEQFEKTKKAWDARHGGDT
jgi:predicted transcriptional regulator